MKYILALDIGTQSVRAAIVDVDGKILGIEQIKHEVDSPHPGWAQQSGNMWWENICVAIGKIISQTGIDPKSIAVVSSCGQMHGMVGVDEQGVVTTEQSQLWCDKRCQSESEAVQGMLDENETAEAITANPIVPSWTALKLIWFKENTPEDYNRSRWFLVPKDFINYRLTGVAATDPSEASGSYIWDWKTDTYSPELAAKIGVDVELFAPSYDSHAVIGEVTEEASRSTGVPVGTPVVAGGGDFPVSMLGFGIVGEGIASDVTGTSTLFAMHSPQPLIHRSVFNLRHVVDGWIPFKLLDTGGLSMKWCRDLVGSMRDDEIEYDELIEMARRAPAGSDGLLFYPYMLGERRLDNTAARGGFVGITINHAAEHFIRSVMEGVALTMGMDKRLFAQLGVPIQRMLCVGGGTRNELWNSIKADVVDMPLELSEEPEAGLKGAAILGAAGVGLCGDPATVAQERRATTRVVDPTPENRKVYDRALDEFARVYDHMLGFWQ